jgi:hypothetical protein
LENKGGILFFQRRKICSPPNHEVAQVTNFSALCIWATVCPNTGFRSGTNQAGHEQPVKNFQLIQFFF